jgi:FtsZ-binding cell division protein ZapB
MTQELITELREWRIASAPYEPEYKVPPSDLHLKAADALERLTAERDSLKEDYTRIKESAALWHDRYKTKCQESVDRQAILGAEIVALEAERDDLGDDLAQAKRYIETLTAERDVAETLAEIDDAIGEKT